MTMVHAHTLAERYVRWVRRRSAWILAATAAVLAAAAYLIAFQLPLQADFSNLLPQDAPAVRDLRTLQRRLVLKDATLAVVVAPDPATREAATRELIDGMRGSELVEGVDVDDRETREYIRRNAHMLVPLATLVEARDALAKYMAGAKLRANPLYIDLEGDEHAAQDVADKRRFDELRAKRRDAEATLARSGFVSADGKVGVVSFKTSFFAAGDIEKAHRMLRDLEAASDRVRASHPGVTIGLTGGVPTSVAEHRALLRGIILSTAITIVLVALVLLLHLRSMRLLVLVTVNIAIATAIAFGLAAVTVGHLNAATAFLGAIIGGNGVNYGLLLTARFIEEQNREPGREPGRDRADALAVAVAGTLRPTLVAALGASIAYGALAATSFRGFADFALIGGLGMLVCWIGSYVTLPALLVRFGAVGPRRSLFGGVALMFRVRRPGVACGVSAVMAVVAAVITIRYIAEDPFEYDMTKLRSEASDAETALHWKTVVDTQLGQSFSDNCYVLTDAPHQVPAIVTQLRQIQATPDGRATIGGVFSILDVVPADQAAKRPVLEETRRMLDDATLEVLDEPERSELRALRPPEELRDLKASELPAELKLQLTELDGTMGNIIIVRPPHGFNELDGRQLLRFAGAVRGVHGDGVALSGSSLIFADIITVIRRDGPLVTALAAVGLVVMVLLVVGPNRRGVAVLAGTAVGSLAMIAICALVKLRVNFLDFVALPITLGLGVDYAVNIADRADRDPEHALRTTGATVLVCSLTTMIGYASLLVSDNLGIRSFGLASLIGEVTCVTAALVLVPAIVALRLRRTLK